MATCKNQRGTVPWYSLCLPSVSLVGRNGYSVGFVGGCVERVAAAVVLIW